ncbi:hypothetical protein FEDK69T_08130 [Flavobacterium enshiense DK69]|uniref:Uncharacterized protein n=1 Tax=Flavobacterium enshiense DK69 TaxID=1107311 RepID=V6SCM5_9FLAO|nr:hypothetical protein [Flavobacterium enshiense]ESU24366.1 hypothetical protein FEDK69T_08130 [Flavobacterium enshiense DK69]KGO94471.1 hypothetical protein Q767_12945 [Flavobacterium enshiense DK69]
MKKLFYFILLSSTIIHGQQMLMVGEKTYSATDTWTFGCECPSSIAPEILIAKGKDGKGMLSIKIMDYMNDHVGGDLLIYLMNGTIIKCQDRKIRDKANNKSTSLYYLTQLEIEKMSTSRIRSIRFCIHTLDPYGHIFSKETFIGYNKEYFSDNTKFDTEVQISELFGSY